MRRIWLLLMMIMTGAAMYAPSAVSEPVPSSISSASQIQDVIATRFKLLIENANKHDIQAIHGMFWQSPSALLIAKSAIPSEGNWAGFWGNDAIDQKLHDIAASGPVVLQPDYAKLRVVALTRDVAESYAPVTITVSYAGQDGTPKPFLMIIEWLKEANDWKVASEILLPVPPSPSPKP